MSNISQCELSIVIPIGADYINSVHLLLADLAKQSILGQFEVIGVLNPSGAAALENNYASFFCIFFSDTANVNKARNLGALNSRGKWIYYIDADCRINSKFHLRNLLFKLKEINPETILGGPYSFQSEDLREKECTYSDAYHFIQDRWIRGGKSKEYGWCRFLGGNVVFHREVFTKFNFDPEITFGGSETDLVIRLLTSGYKGFFEPQLAVEHQHMLARRQFLWKAFMQGYGSARIQEKGLPQLIPDEQNETNQIENTQLCQFVKLYGYAFDIGRQHFYLRKSFPGFLKIEKILLIKKFKDFIVNF